MDEQFKSSITKMTCTGGTAWLTRCLARPRCSASSASRSCVKCLARRRTRHSPRRRGLLIILTGGASVCSEGACVCLQSHEESQSLCTFLTWEGLGEGCFAPGLVQRLSLGVGFQAHGIPAHASVLMCACMFLCAGDLEQLCAWLLVHTYS